MQFDSYTVALLRPTDPPLQQTPAEEDALQDEHLAYLAGLHDMGELLAVGPVPGPPDRRLRGFAIYRGTVERTAELVARDPAVIAGKFTHEIHPWVLPAGLVEFRPGRLPRSQAEATA